ncbi:hypothetical protein DWB84_15055 [Saccharophagus sp. K07]|jgi:hypothetical protein|uniref:transglycosylase SLT domain-containing protein n=1 Tax=Saccharophagus sp. K07 TaxID=2283636 RepID=UPI0016524F2C|nr:transglycosylase SLT domain-containing protein [Saccharophagus sp. K07]MBC6906768.1 hypothetical protein [Saccharophagus sp. K07]
MRWTPLFGVMSCLLLSSCIVTSPPRQADNICSIFKEKRSWYKQANKAAQRWNTTVPIIMAIIHQESGFVGNAKPPRRKFLKIIPGPRISDAYGYAQAKDATWEWYQKSTGRWGADRRDFGDSADFVGWYNRQSLTISKIPPHDVYNLYLAYHEGHGGFNRKTYSNKPWLKGVATKVQQRASRYQQQLLNCEEDLQKRRWWIF